MADANLESHSTNGLKKKSPCKKFGKIHEGLYRAQSIICFHHPGHNSPDHVLHRMQANALS